MRSYLHCDVLRADDVRERCLGIKGQRILRTRLSLLVDKVVTTTGIVDVLE
jgi:hypothetical protein